MGGRGVVAGAGLLLDSLYDPTFTIASRRARAAAAAAAATAAAPPPAFQPSGVKVAGGASASGPRSPALSSAESTHNGAGGGGGGRGPRAVASADATASGDAGGGSQIRQPTCRAANFQTGTVSSAVTSLQAELLSWVSGLGIEVRPPPPSQRRR